MKLFFLIALLGLVSSFQFSIDKGESKCFSHMFGDKEQAVVDYEIPHGLIFAIKKPDHGYMFRTTDPVNHDRYLFTSDSRGYYEFCFTNPPNFPKHRCSLNIITGSDAQSILIGATVSQLSSIESILARSQSISSSLNYGVSLKLANLQEVVTTHSAVKKQLFSYVRRIILLQVLMSIFMLTGVYVVLARKAQ